MFDSFQQFKETRCAYSLFLIYILLVLFPFILVSHLDPHWDSTKMDSHWKVQLGRGALIFIDTCEILLGMLLQA